MLYPTPLLGVAQPPTLSAFTLDASGEYLALIFRAPRAGNLRSIAARIAAITNAPDNGLRFSFQGVGATGLPDGGVDQFATIAGASLVVGWNDPGNFDADRAVVRGEVVAAVIDFPSFVVGDSLTVGRIASDAQAGTYGCPYAVLNAVKQGGGLPNIAIMYDDGVYEPLGSLVIPITALTNVSYDSASALDEYGLTITPPCPMRCVGMGGVMQMASGGVTEFLLYQGTTVVRTATVDTDLIASNGADAFHEIVWDDGSYDLQANVTYTLALRPTDAANIDFVYMTLPSAAVAGAMLGGNTIHMSARVNQGAWTHYNNASDGFLRPPLYALLSAVQNQPPFVIGG